MSERSEADVARATALGVHGVTVNFGGNVALDNVELSAAEGRITGLIGPNGAGKTTLFNVCSGLLRPARGRVHLFGADVTATSVAGRARMGLGRTFQRMELFDSRTVRENVAMGREASLADRNPLHHLFTSRRQRAEIDEVADAALHRCGIAELAALRAGALSTGQRRLVELARALAGGYRMLLLDEPASGLDRDETERFGDILLDAIGNSSTSLLLVEHDVELVMRVCDHIYVLDFGRIIFEGDAEAARTSDVVRDAYLGSV